MAIHTKLAKKVLTKAEQDHLTKDGNIHSMAAMKRQIKSMEGDGSICWDCWFIGRKLGIIDHEGREI